MFNVAVQVELEPDATLTGEQVSADIAGNPGRVWRAEVALLPFSDAVTVAVWLLLTLAVVALNAAEVAPPTTVTDAGTVRAELLLDRLRPAPPVGAAWVKDTVQVLEELGPRLVGLHANDDTSTGATRLTLAVAELLV